MSPFIENPDPSIFLGNNYVVLDFETGTFHGDYGHPMHPDNKLLLACWRLGPDHPCRRVEGEEFGIWGGEYTQQTLVHHIKRADFIVAHNAKYELGWLKRCGVDLRTVLAFDTKIAEYVLAGNLAAADDKQGLKPIATDLGSCCRRRGLPDKDPVTDLLITGDVNPAAIPPLWLEGRCRRDVQTTEQIFLDQRRVLEDSGRLPVMLTRCILTPVLSEIECEGMFLDSERVEKTWEEFARKRAKLESEFDELTGGINWNSPKQVSHYIYDELGFDEIRDFRGNVKRNKPTSRNPEGTRLTDKDSLALLEAKTPKQKKFVELKRSLSKVANALSKNLDFFRGVCHELGGLCHFEFSQTRTGTHRLSSTGVKTFFKLFGDFKTAQGQNIPRAFKKLFTAREPGWLMGEADGASLEFRAAGMVTNDPQIREDVVTHHDIHRESASAVFDIPVDEVTGEQRQAAKEHTFGPLYGKQFGPPEVVRWVEKFRKRYAKTYQTQESWVERVLRDKVLVLPWGLRLYWPTAKRSKSGYVKVSTAIYNYPIQGFATAEIIPIAVAYFWHRMADTGVLDRIRLVNTIHDSIVVEIRSDAIEEFKELAKMSFTDDVYRYVRDVYGMDLGRTGIPLGVGIKIGSHWSEGQEEKWNVFADGRREQYE